MHDFAVARAQNVYTSRRGWLILTEDKHQTQLQPSVSLRTVTKSFHQLVGVRCLSLDGSTMAQIGDFVTLTAWALCTLSFCPLKLGIFN